MTKYFPADERFGVETSQNMDPAGTLPPGAGVRRGVMRAHLTVYEPEDEHQPHPSLPTIRELLSTDGSARREVASMAALDPATGLLIVRGPSGERLPFDPAPLRELDPELRVGPGCSFVSHEALARARQR